MDNKSEKIVKLFPLATTRLNAFTDYLNMMYRNGYRIVDMKYDSVLYFKKTTPKSGYSYYVLTRYCTYGPRKNQWNDMEFLERINPKIHYGDGVQIEKVDLSVNAVYSIYFTKFVQDSDYDAVKNYRKKRIRGVNSLRLFGIFFILVIIPCLFLLYILAEKRQGTVL